MNRNSRWLIGAFVLALAAPRGSAQEVQAPGMQVPGMQVPSVQGPGVQGPGVQAHEMEVPAEPQLAEPGQPGSPSLFLGAQRETERRARELRRLALRNISQLRHREAIEQLRELVALDPYDADYHISLGVLFGKVKNLEEARRKFQDFMDLGGSPAVAHLLLAETYVESRDRKSAFEHLRKAAEHGLNLMKAAKESPMLAGYSEDTEFIKLALQLEQYQLDSSGRRDPMTAVFRRAVQPEEASQTGPEELADRLGKEEQEQILKGAKRCLVRIEIFLGREDEARAMEAYRELQGFIAQSDNVTIPMLASELRVIVEQKQQIEQRIKEIRLKYYYSEAQQLVAQLQRSFDNRDYSQVATYHEAMKKIGEQMVAIDSEFREVARMIVEVADDWLQRARIRQEFDAKMLKIQGIVTHNGPPLVILNNRALGIGEEVEDMVLVQIEPNQVVFNFRGEEIPLLFRRY